MALIGDDQFAKGIIDQSGFLDDQLKVFKRFLDAGDVQRHPQHHDPGDKSCGAVVLARAAHGRIQRRNAVVEVLRASASDGKTATPSPCACKSPVSTFSKLEMTT